MLCWMMLAGWAQGRASTGVRRGSGRNLCRCRYRCLRVITSTWRSFARNINFSASVKIGRKNSHCFVAATSVKGPSSPTLFCASRDGRKKLTKSRPASCRGMGFLGNEHAYRLQGAYVGKSLTTLIKNIRTTRFPNSSPTTVRQRHRLFSRQVDNAHADNVCRHHTSRWPRQALTPASNNR